MLTRSCASIIIAHERIVASSRRFSLKVADRAIHMGSVQGVDVWVQSTFALPVKLTKEQEANLGKTIAATEDRDGYISPFWAVPEADPANMKLSLLDETIGTGAAKMSFKVPTMINVKPLQPGDFLVCEPWSPPKKRAKINEA